MDNKYIFKLPKDASFEQNGLKGYTYNLDLKEMSFSIEDVFKGHDRYCTNIRSTHYYYVVDGEGKFSINDDIYNVKKDDFVVIPPNNNFCFAGEMKLLLIMNPAFREQDDIKGKENDLY